MSRIWKPLLSISIILTAASPLLAKPVGPSGPTSEQIYCQNRAVNDYWDQVKECDKALGDIPSQNAQCKSDAAADLRRNKAACLGSAAIRRNGTAAAVSGQPAATR